MSRGRGMKPAPETARRSTVGPWPGGLRDFLSLVLPIVLAGLFPESLLAQTPLFLVNSETVVSSVEFEFPEGRTLEESRLKEELALRGPGLGHRIQGWVAFLPLVSRPRLQSFHPPELLRDRARLGMYYRDAGFPEAEVEYRVSLDTVPNAVDVTFVVREGPPRILDSVSVTGPEGEDLSDLLPERLASRWPAFLSDLGESQGARLSTSLMIHLHDEVSNWLSDRGYPFPRVSGRAEEGEDVLFRLTVDPGSRSRVDGVALEGNDILSNSVLLREVPLGTGEWFSQAALAEGEGELMGLNMVRFASARAEDSIRSDSLVDLRIRVQDGLPHLVTGQVGYTTRSGISGDASWSHRNFLGGARILEVSGTARTGLLGLEDGRAERYGLSVLLRQPWFFHRQVAGMVRPFTELRDDIRDRSLEGGLESSLLFERGARRNVTLRYALTYRAILDSRPGGAIGQDQELVEVLRSLDTLNLDRRTSSLALSTRWGPHRTPGPEAWDWSVQGTGEVAGPPGLSMVEYGKVVMEGSVGRLVLPWLRAAVRVGFGRVFPYGVSVPAPDGSDRLEVYLKLRDATLTAGGARDVRGWGNELLGPKLPDFRLTSGDEGDDAVRAGRYIPLGGLARWTGSLQLEFPFPGLGWPHGTHLFLDGGRVWTPDGRFLPTAEPLVPDQLRNRPRFGTGLGVSFSTPVGPLQLDLGYKLNPTLLDLRNPGAVARALAGGEDVASVPEEALRRWHLHFSIGRIR